MEDETDFNPFRTRTLAYKMGKDYDERRVKGAIRAQDSFLHFETKPKSGTVTPNCVCTREDEDGRECRGIYFPIIADKAHERCSKCFYVRGPKPEDLLCGFCERRKASMPKGAKNEVTDHAVTSAVRKWQSQKRHRCRTKG
jgi:hypothetical protein